MQPFTPSYIFETELSGYGLPTPDVQRDIMGLVQLASVAIDENCGRLDSDGNGSMVYTTYTQRILLQTRNRNLFQLAFKPITPLSAATIASLQGLATSGANNANYYYTGALANTLNRSGGSLSGIIGASGRYGYVRQDMQAAYPDIWNTINPLNLLSLYGGPAPWTPIDVTNTDYDERTGEVWIPAGLQLTRYSEVLIQYNAGYDPRAMHPVVKNVCAAVVKNAMAKGGGTTGIKSMSMGQCGVNFSMDDSLIDALLDRMLTPFRIVRAA